MSNRIFNCEVRTTDGRTVGFYIDDTERAGRVDVAQSFIAMVGDGAARVHNQETGQWLRVAIPVTTVGIFEGNPEG